jgi:two-component system, NarL family, sensor histidine kinase UhpB
MRKPALLTQVLAVNTVLITATVLAASVAANLRLESALAEQRSFLVLAAAILATALVNAFVLRRRFAPLGAIIDTMERVDLAQPGVRVATEADSADVERLHGAFNRMVARLEDERAGAARAVLLAQEAERARLGRDLHDEVNQALTGVLLRLQATAQSAPPELAAELRETQAVATQAMGELRALAHELRPGSLDDLGLEAALGTLVDEFAARTALRTTLELRGHVDGFRSDEQLVVYRVVQEALSNIARHACAGAVHVEVVRRHARGSVRVVDDGRGILAGRPDGHGMAGMRERALQAGGRLDVHSAPGHGTTVELTLGRTAPEPADASTVLAGATA